MNCSHPAKVLKGLALGPAVVFQEKEVFCEDLFQEVEDTKIAESGSGIRIPGCGDEVQTATDVVYGRSL